MAKNKLPYSEEELDKIKTMLEAEKAEGKPVGFEVKVDGIPRILKTQNVSRFDELYKYINENTKEVLVVFYSDVDSTRGIIYTTLCLDAEDVLAREKKAAPLNGPESLDTIVEAKKAAFIKDFKTEQEITQLKKLVAEKQELLDDAEKHIIKLEGELAQLQVKPNHIGNIDVAKLVSSAFIDVATRKPQAFENVPVLNGIAYAISSSPSEKQNTSTAGNFEGEVSFKEKSESESGKDETHEEKYSEQELVVKNLTRFISEHFNEEQANVLGQIIQTLGEKPQEVFTVADLLNIETGN